MVITPRYDVLELKYGDGRPAVLRHVDGSGFAYYQSGRKAVCVSAFGKDGKGKVRRFAAIVHADSSKSSVAAAFDEWGRGYADGQLSAGDVQPPKLIVSESSLTVVDGSGRSTDLPLANGPGQRQAAAAGQTPDVAGSAEVALRINASLVLHHRRGRTSIDFESGGVRHTFILGELRGEEVTGMPSASTPSLAEETLRQLGEATKTLDGVREKVGALRVSPSTTARLEGLRYPASAKMKAGAEVSDLQKMLDGLNDLTRSLSGGNLAPVDLKWKTEGRLKQMLSTVHPMCPGQQDRKNWSISRVSGRCTEERLANAKPTVDTPKTVEMVSQLRLPDLIDASASRGALLVVICLATYALEQSNHARLLAEKVHAEMHKRFSKSNSDISPVQFVSIELTELGGFADRYGVKEAPYCLMFQGGSLVHSKRLRGMRLLPKDAGISQPRVLLAEPLPQHQLKLERSLRRSGCSWDLAMDGPQALRLASRQVAYDAVLISGRLRVSDWRSIISSVRREEPDALVLLFDAGLEHPDDDAEARKRFEQEECSHIFAYSPSYTALMALLSRCDTDDKRRAAGAGMDKQELLDEVLCAMDPSKRTAVPAGGAGAAEVAAA